ncbi:MAG: hypothetical protein V3U86_00095 [Acidobacteriota bacterium]
MTKPPVPDFIEILNVLVRHEVKFIIVGGVCGVLHGAPVSTFDLDLVHSRDAGNVDRILKALDELEARYRIHAEQFLKPVRSHLESPGHQLLVTRAGPLDLLGAIGKGRDYEDLVQHSEWMKVGSSRIRVLGLETLIQIKEELGGEKDRAILPILRRTLDEKRKR